MKLKTRRKKCECGCGKLATWNKRGKRWNRFIYGHILKQKGNKNIRYTNGNYSDNNSWKKSVFIRDNYICQDCNKKDLVSKDCHAHHIKPRDEYPELIYNIDNGLTLCASCHKVKHNIGNTYWLGKKATKEHRAKLSAAQTGKKHPHSEETKRKISAALKGKHLSEETKKKLSIALIGNKNRMKTS